MPDSGDASELPRPKERSIVVVAPASDSSLIDLREIYAYRELIWSLVMRELTVRYKQALIGFAWIVVQPVISTTIFTLLFGVIARFPSDNARYPTFVLTGILLWSYFSKVVADGTNCIVANRGMITKIYFPRIIIPLSHAIEALVDFAIVLALLLGLILVLGGKVTISILALPVFLVIAMAFGFGLACLTGALNVMYRDIKFIVMFALQIGFFATPVVYPVSFVPAEWSWILWLNPLTLVIEGARWALLGTGSLPSMPNLVVSLAVTAAATLGGVWSFQRMEGRFVEFDLTLQGFQP